MIQTAPQVRMQQTPDGPAVQFTFNALAGRALGTTSPAHDFIIQSNEAVNIPPTVRVFQNQRDSDARAEVFPLPTGISPNEALVDIVVDPVRPRLYISNSGLNRVEVFDTRERRFLSPIKVGQLPRSLALTPDGNTLYVANTNSEYISVIDVEKGEVAGRLRMPPIPFNAGFAIITPSVIAASQRGLQVVMSNGTLWKEVGGDLVPRPQSTILGATVLPQPRTMVSTPNGEYVLLLDGNGFASLYEALVDDFVQRRQVATAPIQGSYGPVSAGPRGQYFLVNGMVLNQNLSPMGTAPQQQTRPITAVAAIGPNTFARFAQPVRANANALPTEAPLVELVDVNTGLVMRSAPALEGPISTVIGTQRVNTNGRSMVVDPSGSSAYALTTSGLSIVPLDLPAVADRPVMNPNGTVNLANYTTATAPGGLISIFGRNLGRDEFFGATPLATILGGTCVTLNNRPLPLLMTSAGQINAQVPVDLAAGRYPLVVRSVDRRVASVAQQVTVSRYAPSIFVDPTSGQTAIFHADGRPVNSEHPARRDERLVMYATGLGVTRGGRVTSGAPAPSDPLATTDPIEVFFGDERYSQSEMIVEWSGLAPGYIGLYQINLYVPGNRMRGDNLPVTLRIGTSTTPTSAPLMPVVSVE
jgi:uncharacterized protein (TIGR03437 family)